jgi:hypothetical protein
MGFEEPGIAAGSGLLGAVVGGLAAFFGLRERVAVQDQKINDMAKLVEEFKHNMESVVTRIETAHERHASLVVYKDTCGQCAGKQDAKLDGIAQQISYMASNFARRRDDKK